MRNYGVDNVHWEFNATNADTVRTVTVYDKTGAAISVAANDQFFLCNGSIKVGATGMTAQCFIDYSGDGAVTAGELVAGGAYIANAGESFDFGDEGRPLPKGSNLFKVLTSAAAACVVVANGYRRKV